MLILAVSALEKVKTVPGHVWLKIALGILIFIVAVIVLRKLAGMNKILLGAIVFVVVMIVGFQWIYERNEPKFLTPLVDKVAPFFPSKGSYVETQRKGPNP